MSTFLDRLKAGAGVVADATKRGAEELQLKRQLSQAYDEIGQRTVELVESGQLTHTDLAPLVGRVKELKARLETSDQQHV